MTRLTAPVQTTSRVVSVDLLRGLIMIVMALDHVRDYFSPFPWDPTDLSKASAGLFLTRWITHFCAPVFVFLAGTSAWLYRRNSGCTMRHLQGFLVTRGLWLVLLEITLISFFWQFGYRGMILQTLWSLGWSMVALAALLYLPPRWILVVGLAMIFGHNALDGIHAQDFGPYAMVWAIIHEFYFDQVTPNFFVAVGYPLVPWIGVMAAGYCFGQLLELERSKRDRLFMMLGLACIALFLVLRLSNLYGDARLWAPNSRGFLYTALQVLNTTKYPPSLQYLLMTIGPSLLLMPLLESWRGAIADRVAVFGRVPFFFYVLHLPLIHLAALIWTETAFGASTLGDFFHNEFVPGYTPSLLRVYLVWAAVIVVTYPLCAWYAAYKRAHKDNKWLSYL
ncbi:MAG TPA: heparan-alpha-glucosaminide N-acetyltransferase domain-containing protein [Rhodanobacteraceae bacterium]|nr:heparan-alpha-glucosaminide N-acetyltransferase domain-containing protein [Rhodanobacteraceae bacterium]